MNAHSYKICLVATYIVVAIVLGTFLCEVHTTFESGVNKIEKLSNDTTFYSVNRYVIEVKYVDNKSKNEKQTKQIEIGERDLWKIDSICQLNERLHSEVLRNQDRLINDIRQETNNNIDKVSAWLALWIGIISVVMVFLPIVVQYITYKKDESRLNDIERKNKIAATEQNIKLLTRGLTEIYDGHLINDVSTQRNITRMTMKQIKEQLYVFSELCDVTDGVLLERYRILSIMLIISRTLRELNISADRSKYRTIQDTQDYLRNNINTLSDTSEVMTEKRLKSMVKNLCSRLDGLDI